MLEAFARCSTRQLVLALLLWLVLAPGFVQAAEPPITEDEAYAIGVEAYTYAYPLVLMELTRRVATNVAEPDTQAARADEPLRARAAYADARSRDVVRPNADTLYSTLWFDVGREPLVLTLPDTGDRYHVSRSWTCGPTSSPRWARAPTATPAARSRSSARTGRVRLPKGVRPIVSPTEVGWIIGRIQTNGEGDYDHVHKLQAGLKAVPLSAWGKPYTPPPAASIRRST